ncbi:hypothetical protein GVN21_10170 [Caulobacter sp. SLTY]|uniref:hypothetical protein n=1 Tax=Caulobacter sp. SLTY TaxID=2683262 RepID=UPI0014134972|nr:hypothetical protein [Caulobacter sp. SLTY]NBB15719.1 hypothetical protein [Caulobacter sp. SLTY]
MSEALVHCIRIPKSGSTSLTRMLGQAFEDRGRFYLPDTLRREASLSGWQAFRLWRSQTQNLVQKLGVLTLDAALRKIEAEGRPGDLIAGGHSDVATVRRRVTLPVRFVTLMREPAERARSDYNYARAGYLKKKPWQRFDAHILAGAAGRYDFAGFLDFQLDHPEVFGDLAAAYLGWPEGKSLDAHLTETLWDWATLETADKLAARLTARMGKPVAFGRHNKTQTIARSDISADERAKIERLCARDYELYQRCLADNG